MTASTRSIYACTVLLRVAGWPGEKRRLFCLRQFFTRELAPVLGRRTVSSSSRCFKGRKRGAGVEAAEQRFIPPRREVGEHRRCEPGWGGRGVAVRDPAPPVSPRCARSHPPLRGGMKDQLRRLPPPARRRRLCERSAVISGSYSNPCRRGAGLKRKEDARRRSKEARPSGIKRACSPSKASPGDFSAPPSPLTRDCGPGSIVFVV